MRIVFILLFFIVSCEDESFSDDKNIDEEGINFVDDDVLTDADNGVPNCLNLSEDECLSTSGCYEIKGFVANFKEQCWDKPVNVGCAVFTYSCTASISFAYSPVDNKCYLFGSGCIPEGWVAAENNDNSCNYSLFNGDTYCK